MTDTTNTLPLIPVRPYGAGNWRALELDAIEAYGDARAAHAVSQIKARDVTDAEIDALLHEVKSLGWLNRDDMHGLVRAAIALANGRG